MFYHVNVLHSRLFDLVRNLWLRFMTVDISGARDSSPSEVLWAHLVGNGQKKALY